ncbi:hypothetical protein LCGC14_0234740 [marine sediment metagenome]|uniref:Uncharacterized protein n=1 Tax=marine sediment metagenome TaxID=412755 RepID=A0A0F9XCY6_9ZZZZ
MNKYLKELLDDHEERLSSKDCDFSKEIRRLALAAWCCVGLDENESMPPSNFYGDLLERDKGEG